MTISFKNQTCWIVAKFQQCNKIKKLSGLKNSTIAPCLKVTFVHMSIPWKGDRPTTSDITVHVLLTRDFLM